ncbi:MAG: hypothetical protein ACYCZD_11425 [Rhodanobacter sp.]
MRTKVTAAPLEAANWPTLDEYHAFRASICASLGRIAHGGPVTGGVPRDPGGSANGKDRIRAFRRAVDSNADQHPALLVARALGLRSTWESDMLPRPWWVRLWWLLQTDTATARRQLGVITHATTYEGRAFLLRRITTTPRHYGDFLHRERDFLLRRFGPAATARVEPKAQEVTQDPAIAAVRCLRAPHLRIAWQLGLRSLEDLLPHAAALADAPEGILMAWRHHGLLNSIGDLARLAPPARRRIVSIDPTFDRAYWQLLSALRGAGASPASLAKLHHLNCGLFPPPPATLTLLAQHGLEVDAVLEACGSRLWTCDSGSWRFVIACIGATTPEAIGRFGALLDAPDRHLDATVVAALRARSATLDVLQAWQPWLSTHNYRIRPPTADHIDLLLAHGITLADLPSAPAYLAPDAPERLATFLPVAAEVDATAGSALLALAPAFGAVDRQGVAELLPLHAVFGSPDLEVWARFVADFLADRGRPGSLRFLHDHYGIGNLRQANQLRQLGQLDPRLLAYQFETCGRRRWRELTGWFYDGPGTGAVRIRLGNLPPLIEAAVLDAAEHLGAYGIVEPCLTTIDAVLRQAAKERETTVAEVVDSLMQHLPGLLRADRGLPAPSLLREALLAQPAFGAVRRRVQAERRALASGGGPIGEALSREMLESVASAYRVDPDRVERHWPNLIGIHRKARAFAPVTARHHHITWHRMVRRLKEPLPGSQRDALTRIADLATAWANGADVAKLSPKALREPSASLETVAGHIALLQVILTDPEQTDAPARWGTLFIDPDAVADDLAWVKDLYAERWRLALPSAAAGRLAIAAGSAAAMPESIDSVETATALYRALGPVLDRWLAGILARTRAVPATPIPLLASVTTAPAAFFARAAAHLCTAENLGMWTEERHAHLVVFDPATGTLEGMAMLYLEVFPEVDPSRRTLVMRAFNLPVSQRELYDPCEVISTLIDVGRIIAGAGGHAGLALPDDDSGQHLLSNDPTMQRQLQDRINRSDFRRVGLSSPFHGYALHSVEGTVSAVRLLCDEQT